jgi:hypothetical protein
MTGPHSLQQYVRVAASIPALTPITSRCIPVDSDQCATVDDETWVAMMTAKYGDAFETRDFDEGSL